jgi:hypothetical protein
MYSPPPAEKSNTIPTKAWARPTNLENPYSSHRKASESQLIRGQSATRVRDVMNEPVGLGSCGYPCERWRVTVAVGLESETYSLRSWSIARAFDRVWRRGWGLGKRVCKLRFASCMVGTWDLGSDRSGLREGRLNWWQRSFVSAWCRYRSALLEHYLLLVIFRTGKRTV